LVEELSAAEATAPVPRSRPVASAGLSDQIALIDAARAAVSSGAGERALTLLRQYRDKYPAGSFRPEARVLQIEALMKLGRGAEARPLAERFVAEHRGSPLADRAARVAGLSPPSR
jgi:outer membrane protein assembly factor BamD (BamD/ComL family)